MLLVDVVIFASRFPPIISVWWEEGVSLCGCIVDLSETETISYWQCLQINASATNDVDILILGTML